MNKLLATDMLEIAAEFSLTPHETFVLATLVSDDRWWPTWEIGLKIPGSHASDRTMKVHVHRIRRKLRERALKRGAMSADDFIEGQYGKGYRISPETRQRLLNWPTSQAA